MTRILEGTTRGGGRDRLRRRLRRPGRGPTARARARGADRRGAGARRRPRAVGRAAGRLRGRRRGSGGGRSGGDARRRAAGRRRRRRARRRARPARAAVARQPRSLGGGPAVRRPAPTARSGFVPATSAAARSSPTSRRCRRPPRACSRSRTAWRRSCAPAPVPPGRSRCRPAPTRSAWRPPAISPSRPRPRARWSSSTCGTDLELRQISLGRYDPGTINGLAISPEGDVAATVPTGDGEDVLLWAPARADARARARHGPRVRARGHGRRARGVRRRRRTARRRAGHGHRRRDPPDPVPRPARVLDRRAELRRAHDRLRDAGMHAHRPGLAALVALHGAARRVRADRRRGHDRESRRCAATATACGWPASTPRPARAASAHG